MSRPGRNGVEAEGGASVKGDDPQAVVWRRYRRWRWAFWLLFVLFLPTLALIFRALGSRDSGGPIVFIAAAWMIAFSVAGYQTSNFSCPRCGKLFFRKFDARPWRQSWAYNPFARKCMHCGLPKWTGGARDAIHLTQAQ